MSPSDLANAIGEIQRHVLLTNVFPAHTEQQKFLQDLIQKYPHTDDIADLMTRVSTLSSIIQQVSGDLLTY